MDPTQKHKITTRSMHNVQQRSFFLLDYDMLACHHQIEAISRDVLYALLLLLLL